MDMRLGIKPLHVTERQQIEKALAVCNGNVRYAAELLEIGRATIYRKLSEYSQGKLGPFRQQFEKRRLAIDWVKVRGESNGPLRRRRSVEKAIETHGGILMEAADSLGVSRARLIYSLGIWYEDNERLIQAKAGDEGISEDEIEVMLRRRTMEEHAKRCGFTPTTGYKMIDEACALVGLRRYRHWLFLA